MNNNFNHLFRSWSKSYLLTGVKCPQFRIRIGEEGREGVDVCGEVSIHVHRVPSLSVSECPCGSCIFWLVARKTRPASLAMDGVMVDVSNKIIFVNVWMDVGLDREKNIIKIV